MDLLQLIIIFVIVISVHEFSHAYAAYLLGDETAKNEGRLTLNPLAHLDLTGTLLLFFVGFGWGKPVPVDERFFKRPRIDNALTALAGPLSNILMALFAILILKYVAVYAFLKNFIYLNLILAVFNLLPIPPLDGSHILELFLPKKLLAYYLEIKYSLPFYFFVFLLADSYFNLGFVSLVLRFLTDLLFQYLYMIS